MEEVIGTQAHNRGGLNNVQQLFELSFVSLTRKLIIDLLST